MQTQAPLSRLGALAGAVLLILSLVACTPNWEFTIYGEAGDTHPVTRGTWQQIARSLPKAEGNDQSLPLERVLWRSGIEAVDHIELAGQTFAWQDVHEQAQLLANGHVRIGDQEFNAQELRVFPPPESAQVQAKIIGLAPTIAGALAVRSPQKTSGRSLGAYSARHVVVVAIDGLGYRHYQNIKGQYITPLLDSLGNPKLALTVYPGVPRVALAALATGTTPEANGILQADAADVEVDTIFDAVTAANKTSLVVDVAGPSLALRSTASIGPEEGSSDDAAQPGDATMEQALQVIKAKMPDLLWIHLGGLDQIAQANGMYSDAVEEALGTIDGRIHNIIQALPRDSLLLICGTYGMHPTSGDSPSVGYGSLLADDMFVPIWVVQL